MAAEAVRVAVRCRPLSGREAALGHRAIVGVDSTWGWCLVQNPRPPLSPQAVLLRWGVRRGAQHRAHLQQIAYPLVEGVMEGYNGTIFAYGQTGSGKSFTMQGVADSSSQKGIIPRAFEHIFESVQCAENTKFLLRASYLEIYNEDIRDLLGADTKPKLELKEHPEQGVYVQGLSLHTVHSVAQCEQLMDTGCRNRAVAFTLMSKGSSHSHSIFTVCVEICALGAYLEALAGHRGCEATHHPTATLRCQMMDPDDSYEESLSTQRYASRARNIRNKPCINEDPKDTLLREYQEEIKKLKAILAEQMGTSDLSGVPGEAGPAPGQYQSEQASCARLEKNISSLRDDFDLKVSVLQDLLGKKAGVEEVLQQVVLGGEQAQNKDLKEKHKRRMKHAEERRLQLAGALQESSEDSSEQALLKVYDSIQEEVRAKSKALEKVQEKSCLIAGAADSVCRLQPEEDHYRLVLDRSDSETIASNYFRSRRASPILQLDQAPAGSGGAAGSTVPQARPFRLQALALAPSADPKRRKGNASPSARRF
ncbi:unnamed protein product [Coccothraustes coccothraustes]